MKILITQQASNKIHSLMSKQPYTILRIGVKGGGCSGYSYVLEFVENSNEEDIKIDVDGLSIICDPKSAKYLDGMEIYFDTNLLNGGVKFRNPNAKSTCSCGESFST